MDAQRPPVRHPRRQRDERTGGGEGDPEGEPGPGVGADAHHGARRDMRSVPEGVQLDPAGRLLPARGVVAPHADGGGDGQRGAEEGGGGRGGRSQGDRPQGPERVPSVSLLFLSAP